MKKLFLSWQDPFDRRWIPIGCLELKGNIYRFYYTKGATQSDSFMPFGRMKDIYDIYESEDLFPLFANRLLSSSRPDYKRFIKWLNLQEKDVNPFMILSLTGGIRRTDSIELFPCPEPTPEGYYLVKFFSHGLSHFPEQTKKRIEELNPGDKLFLMADLQNPKDSVALTLRTDEPYSMVGYCPRYFANDFNLLLKYCGADSVHTSVVQYNPDAPLQLKLLCKLYTKWPNNFKPCSSDLFMPLNDKAGENDSCRLNA